MGTVSTAAVVRSAHRIAHLAQSAGMENVTARTDTPGTTGDQRLAKIAMSARRRRTTTATRMPLARTRSPLVTCAHAKLATLATVSPVTRKKVERHTLTPVTELAPSWATTGLLLSQLLTRCSG